MRAFQLAQAAAEDEEALVPAAELSGLDEEIPVLRVLIRRAVGSGNVDAVRRGVESLRRALETRARLEATEAGSGAPRAHKAAMERLNAVLDELGGEGPGPDEEAEGLSTGVKGRRSPRKGAGRSGAAGSAGRGPDSMACGADSMGRGTDSRGRASVPRRVDGRPPGRDVWLEDRAAELALRHQAGEAEALGLLYQLLEVAIVGVALNERALQPPSAMTLEELRERSRKVLDELARQWGPGVSFLGYFFRTFPSAMARYARQKQRSDEEGGGSGGVGEAEGKRWSGGPYSAEDLASLPEVERQILVLSAVEGQSMRGAARRVGVPEMAAYKLYQQARQRLEGRVRSLEGSELLALRRLVEALHAAAGAEGRLPSRSWALAAAGLKQHEYNQLIGRLEGAGAIEGRAQRQPGRLVDGGATATLARLGIG